MSIFDMQAFRAVFNRPLDALEEKRLPILAERAELLIENAFALENRDLNKEIEQSSRLKAIVQLVIEDMVATVFMTGGYAGVRSMQSTTGPTSDSITFSDVPEVTFGGVFLTARHRELLGLDGNAAKARGEFPAHKPYPETPIIRYTRWGWFG